MSPGAPKFGLHGAPRRRRAGTLGKRTLGSLEKLGRGPVEPARSGSEVAWERSEPRAPSLELLPGARAASLQARPLLSAAPSLSSVQVAPGTKDLGGRWRVRRVLGAQPRGLLVVSGRVSLVLGLFILALLSLPWPLGRRAFFLNSLILSSTFFCLVTPPSPPRLE